jgi:ribonuclease T1
LLGCADGAPQVAEPSATAGASSSSDWLGRYPGLERVSGEEREALIATLGLVEVGGPFPFERDGAVFENREQRLPRQQRGHYREYTVPTEGVKHRGARRVVRGAHAETYYPRDHYETFLDLGERR